MSRSAGTPQKSQSIWNGSLVFVALGASSRARSIGDSVSEWLGYADYATTLRVYAHWIPDTRENNMSAPPVPATASNVVPLRQSAG